MTRKLEIRKNFYTREASPGRPWVIVSIGEDGQTIGVSTHKLKRDAEVEFRRLTGRR